MGFFGFRAETDASNARTLDWSTIEIISLADIERQNAARARRREARSQNSETSLKPTMDERSPMLASATKSVTLDDLRKPAYSGPVVRQETRLAGKGVPERLKSLPKPIRAEPVDVSHETRNDVRNDVQSSEPRYTRHAFMYTMGIHGVGPAAGQVIPFEDSMQGLGDMPDAVYAVSLEPRAASWLGRGIRDALRSVYDWASFGIAEMSFESLASSRINPTRSSSVLTAGNIAYLLGTDDSGLTPTIEVITRDMTRQELNHEAFVTIQGVSEGYAGRFHSDELFNPLDDKTRIDRHTEENPYHF